MKFAPDIIVTSPDSAEVLLVAEAKAFVRNMDEIESGLSRYMVGTSCPVGLLVTPDMISIYRNLYREGLPTSVKCVGKFSNQLTEFTILRPEEWIRERSFEQAVQSWLEQLAQTREVHTSSRELKEAITSHVLPALSAGVVRAAGPRETLRYA